MNDESSDTPVEGGDAACWLQLVCERCGGVREEAVPHECRSAVRAATPTRPPAGPASSSSVTY